MSKRILFVVGSGMGNQVETIPALVRLIKEYGPRIDVVNTFPYAHDMTDTIFRDLVNNIYKRKVPNPSDYENQVITMLVEGHRVPGVPIMPHTPRAWKSMSEVEYNLTKTGLPYTDEDVSDAGAAFQSIEALSDAPDILIHNGYNKVKTGRPDKWLAKSYERFPEVIEKLKTQGLRVGVIGLEDEYIDGCENLTGLPLEQSVAAIKGCRVFLSSDTGTYHVANAVGTPNVVIFTFTSRLKNYDPRFHCYSTMLEKELDCSPCHYTSKHHWLKNKARCRWACRGVGPDEVVKAVNAHLEGEA